MALNCLNGNFYKCLPSNGINSINLQSIFNSRTNSMKFIISSSLNPRIKTKDKTSNTSKYNIHKVVKTNIFDSSLPQLILIRKCFFDEHA